VSARESGRADVAALVAALVLPLVAAAPDVLLRTGRTWELAHATPSRVGGPAGPAENPARTALLRAEKALPGLGAAAFRPDASRRLGPLPGATTPSTAGRGDPASTPRVADLDGRVVDGRLLLRWTPVAGSRGTTLRIEGQAGPEATEHEVDADLRTFEAPVTRTSGTVVVRALPAGVPGAAEARVSIPFKIHVEVVRGSRPRAETGSVYLVLRRPFDGRSVDAEFPFHEADAVGGFSSVGSGGPVVDFQTDLVVAEVRASTETPPLVEVPVFSPAGRVQRDSEGRPVVVPRRADVAEGHEVVLRGPNDERRVLKIP
jgi:hypothetical protein